MIHLRMQLVYLQFKCLSDLKRFRHSLSAKKVFILLGQNGLFAEFSGKEITLAVEQYCAEIVNVPVA